MKKILIAFAIILSMGISAFAQDTTVEKNLLAVVGAGYDDDVTFTTSFGRKIGGLYILPTVEGGKYESVGLDIVLNIPLFVIPGLGTTLSLSPSVSASSEASELFDEGGNPVFYGAFAGGTGLRIGIPGANDSSILFKYKRKEDLKTSAYQDRDYWSASYIVPF